MIILKNDLYYLSFIHFYSSDDDFDKAFKFEFEKLENEMNTVKENISDKGKALLAVL